ncbi:MAG: DUF2905 domain-containing protein [Candidatus Bathyarchaeota archaeon]|nr:DUF2905 domain-containing protein [Candidatus Bathyarchaeota archaeon]
MEKFFTGLGVFFILLGVAFIIASIVVKYLPSIRLEYIPWILLWVYRKDNFWIATSPILIIAGIAYIFYVLLRTGILK